jgi:hypothetical protein
MTIHDLFPFIVAVLFGIAAMGCWILTQGDAAITKERMTNRSSHNGLFGLCEKTP